MDLCPVNRLGHDALLAIEGFEGLVGFHRLGVPPRGAATGSAMARHGATGHYEIADISDFKPSVTIMVKKMVKSLQMYGNHENNHH